MINSETRQSAQGGTFVNLMRDSGFKAVYADKDNKQLLIELCLSLKKVDSQRANV